MGTGAGSGGILKSSAAGGHRRGGNNCGVLATADPREHLLAAVVEVPEPQAHRTPFVAEAAHVRDAAIDRSIDDTLFIGIRHRAVSARGSAGTRTQGDGARFLALNQSVTTSADVQAWHFARGSTSVDASPSGSPPTSLDRKGASVATSNCTTRSAIVAAT